jgi:hypothetical protein
MAYTSTDPWLLAFLGRIHHRPGMYLGDERVRTLATFIRAYAQAREDLGIPEFGEGEELVLDDFEKWLAEKQNDSREVAWPTLIEAVDASERNARTFFRLFGEFLASRGLALTEPSTARWPAEEWRPRKPKS